MVQHHRRVGWPKANPPNSSRACLGAMADYATIIRTRGLYHELVMEFHNDRMRAIIHGVDFRGAPEWDNENGFSAKLTCINVAAGLSLPQKRLPQTLRITINEVERAILIRPRIVRASGFSFKVGSPATASITINADGIIRNLHWNAKISSRIEQLTIHSNALDLWYGEDNAAIDGDFVNREFKARFKAVEECFDLSSGILKIGISVKPPPTPAMGHYNFRTQPYATLTPHKPLKINDAIEAATAIEGLFDILAGFPQRRFEIFTTLTDLPDHRVPVFLATGPSRKTSTDDAFASFTSRRQNLAIASLLDTYLKNWKSLEVMRSTVRYLSGDRIVLPEGFLTACNVIESIGKSAPNSNTNLPQLLRLISKSLKKSDQDLANRFNSEVRNKIFTHSSFKDRYSFVKTILSDLGMSVSLEHSSLSNARAIYRHDIVALKPEHFKSMQAGVGLAWFLGLVWLCRQIGVPVEALKGATNRDIFHISRRTQLPLWGKM